jgi:DNA polymerase elongation subunit (family B)
MKPIGTFDLETDPFKKNRSPRPFLAGFFDGKTIRIWKGENCVRDCYREMRKFPGYIYAHNGGKFDFRYLLPHLFKDKADLRPIKGRAARFILPNECKTEFRDSYCILPVPLKATGGKLEMDYRKLERDVREQHMEEIVTYLKADLRVLHEKVSEFVADYGFGMTLAGRTFDQFKKHFDLNPPKTSQFYDAKFREYYYGGRVEFFELGHLRGKFKLIDINSAYPAAMVKEHAFGVEWKQLKREPKTGAEQCFFRFIGESKGGLPWRGKDKSLSFAPHTGEFFVTGWEYVAAKKAGAVTVSDMISILQPTETRNFSKFVNHFYGMKRRAEKGSSDELFSKLLLNSSYGRFALNSRDFKDVKMTAIKEEPDENHELRAQIARMVLKKFPKLRGMAFAEKCAAYWRGLEGKWELANEFEDAGIAIWEKPSEPKTDGFFNVATAASITGCVRAFIFESLRAVRRPVYCDTDSIICEDTGNLKLGAELGEWKLECESVENGVWIAAKKLYAFKIKGGKKPWKIASKGVRLSAAEICAVANGKTIRTTLAAPTFSVFTTRTVAGSKRDFVTRTTRRDDKRAGRTSTVAAI